MVNLRDIKRKARGDLHQAMSIPALYIAAPGEEGVAITVRLHTKWDAIGMSGEQGLAERRELKSPKIIFWLEEIAEKAVVLKRNGIVSVERGEAYKLDNVDAPDVVTVAWFVAQIPANQTTDLPVIGEP